MTYEKAREQELFMPDMKHMRTTVRQGNPANPNSYYVDYVPTYGTGMGFHSLECTIALRIDMFNRFDDLHIDSVKDMKEPPAGRTQKHHNLIQAMNKKGKRR